MQAPESFVRSLDYQFGGKFRVRFSDRRHRWQIEQRVASDVAAALPPMGNDAQHSYTDDTIRYHDGYTLFAEIAPGTLTPCGNDLTDEAGHKTCGQDLKIPFARKFGVLTCPACEAHHTVAHWPLDESLLEHIRSTDPERNPDLLRKRNSRSEARHEKLKQRAGFRDELANMARDDARVDIAKTGYTGKYFGGTGGDTATLPTEEPSRVRFHKVYK
jgi:hypothetical protein